MVFVRRLRPVSLFDAGIVTRRQLLGAGYTDEQVRELLHTGRLQRVRRGWYALPEAGAGALRAVRLGGALSCVSALAVHGVWTHQGEILHIRRSEHARQARPLPAGVHSCSIPGAGAPTTAVDGLADAVTAAASCLDDEGMVVILDSILNRRLMTKPALQDALARAPGRRERLLAECDGRSQSGTESMVRFRLRRKRVQLRIQVVITEIGRVDLLIGRRLVIEVDSREHHTGEVAYQRDRVRDRKLVAQGYLVIRITYEQVLYGWDEVEADILALIRRDEHRRAPRNTAQRAS